RSLLEAVRDVYRERKGREATPLADVYRRGGDPGIEAWPVVGYAGTAPARTIAWAHVGASPVRDVVVDRYALHHDGLRIPLLHVHGPAPARRTVLRLSLDGKVGPGDWAEVERRVAAGEAILSFDGRGVGENRMRYKAASIDDPELGKLPEEAAYVSPVSGVLANHV